MLGSLVEFDWLFPINRNRRIRHCLFHCLIENTLTLLHVFQIDEIQYIIILLAILILDGTEFSATFVFDIRTGLFSLLGLAIKAFMVDSVIEGINLCKYFSIVTTHPEEICDYIIHKMNRSSTIVDATGAYSHEGCKVVMVACRRGEAVKLRAYVRSVDKKAFMFITNTSEIIGKGFRSVE